MLTRGGNSGEVVSVGMSWAANNRKTSIPTALIMMKVYVFHKKSCGGGTSEQAGLAAQWWRPDQGLSLYVLCHPQYGSLPSCPKMAAADPVITSHQDKLQPKMSQPYLPRVSLFFKSKPRFPITPHWSPFHTSLVSVGSHARGTGQPLTGSDQGSANLAPSPPV